MRGCRRVMTSGMVWLAALVASCGGGDDTADAPAPATSGAAISGASRASADVAICRPDDQVCQVENAARRSRRCELMPGGWWVYLDDLDDEVLRAELQGLGAWPAGGWLRGVDCD